MRVARLARHPVVVGGLAYLAGSVPFSNLTARARTGVDLRTVGDGTVSGTGLYRVAGAGPVVLAGIADVAKGALGPLLAGRRRPLLAASSGAAAVVGHDWSPFLRGAGGRGISVAMGALVVRQWRGSAILLAGVALGRVVDQAGFGGFVADVAVAPVLWRTNGWPGLLMALAVVVPMLAKRVAGNHAPAQPTFFTFAHRLLLDRDPGPER